MDFLAQQFIGAAHRIRKELQAIVARLSTLHEDIQQQVDAINETNETQAKRNESLPVLRAELQVPHPIEVQTSPKDKKQRREWLKLVIETLTLIGVLVYATVAIRQWREMISARHQTRDAVIAANRSAKAAEAAATEAKNANSITKEALVSVQRAYIFTDIGEPTSLSDDTGKTIALVFRIKLENSGSTPTRRMKSHINWRYQVDPVASQFAFPDMFSAGKAKLNAPAAVGPKASINISTDPITMDIVQLVRLQRLHFYLWGWARYHDIFEKTPMRLTEFCYEVRATTGLSTEPRFKVLNIQPQNCTAHNCYDEDCPDYIEQSKKD